MKTVFVYDFDNSIVKFKNHSSFFCVNGNFVADGNTYIVRDISIDFSNGWIRIYFLPL